MGTDTYSGSIEKVTVKTTGRYDISAYGGGVARVRVALNLALPARRSVAISI